MSRHIHSNMLGAWVRLLKAASRGMSFSQTERNLIHDLQLAIGTIDHLSKRGGIRWRDDLWIEEYLDWQAA